MTLVLLVSLLLETGFDDFATFGFNPQRFLSRSRPRAPAKPDLVNRTPLIAPSENTPMAAPPTPHVLTHPLTKLPRPPRRYPCSPLHTSCSDHAERAVVQAVAPTCARAPIKLDRSYILFGICALQGFIVVTGINREALALFGLRSLEAANDSTILMVSVQRHVHYITSLSVCNVAAICSRFNM